MFEVCLLGTGGMIPLPQRHLTSLLTRYNGSNILIDCGEGTQVAIKKKGWSPYPIDLIMFTHYHADHIAGLPGLLLTLGNCERTEPLYIAGPKGLRKIVDALRVISPQLPYEIEYIEYENDVEKIVFKDYHIEAFKVNHKVLCYGYKIEIKRKGKFDLKKAQSLNLPCNYWGKLQSGEEVIYDDKLYTPDMVMGEDRKGLKLVYCTDTRPTDKIVEAAKGADLFICEGMYGFYEKSNNATKYKHMTMEEAAIMARQAQPKSMWYTHYSPSNINPIQYIDELKKIFNNISIPKDGKSIDLKFEED